jgi:transcription elongation factor GreB
LQNSDSGAIAQRMPTHMTLRGAKALSVELQRLSGVERPKVVQEVADAAAQGDRSENAEYIYGKKRLREIDRRVRFLTKRLEDAVVVDVTTLPKERDRVYFGALVRLLLEDDSEARYQLVGPDEARPEAGLLSYQSPIARALLGKRVGDVVTFARPRGDTEVEVLEINYGEYLDQVNEGS